MEQTAVEWLYEQMPIKIKPHYLKQLEQAKELEKQQIMTAFTQGDIFGADFFNRVNITAEKYYNETFKSE
jgi:hypothetical protein